MKKILLGLSAVAVVAVGGYFGFNFYVQHRIKAEVEAAFEQVRSQGGKASHGPVSFDLAKRTVVISDIAVELATEPPLTVKAANLTASGINQPDATHFAADSIEATDLELGYAVAGQAAWTIVYRAPKVTIKDYAGPAGQTMPAKMPAVDIYRYGFEQFAKMAFTSVTIPSVVATINGGSSTPGGGEITYLDMAIRDVRNGKIASMTASKAGYVVSVQSTAGRSNKFNSEFANFVVTDIDISALATILDPQKANDDSIHRIYGKVFAGPYQATSDLGPRTHVDSFAADEIGIRPSKLQIGTLMALVPSPGNPPPTPAQARALIEKVADIYDGIRVTNVEIRGLSMETPDGPFKVSAVRYGLDNGQGDFVVEGVDGRYPNGPIKLDRFALKALNAPHLLRMAALFSNPLQPPPTEQAVGLLRVLEGAEIKGLAAPYKTTNKPVSIDTLSLNWGQFVGSIPSQAHFIARLVMPTDPSEPGLRPLIAAGIDKLALNVDLGAGWTEQSGAFVVAPATIDIGNLLSASARISLANVPRGMFSANVAQAAAMGAQVEVGSIELTLRDAGAADIAIAQFARGQNVDRDTARRAIIEAIKTNGEQVAAGNPDMATLVQALTRFVETPGQTLVVKLTPRAKVPALQLIELVKSDPQQAFAQFRIEASTGL